MILYHDDMIGGQTADVMPTWNVIAREVAVPKARLVVDYGWRLQETELFTYLN